MLGKFYAHFLVWPDWVKFLLLVSLTLFSLTLMVVLLTYMVEHIL